MRKRHRRREFEQPMLHAPAPGAVAAGRVPHSGHWAGVALGTFDPNGPGGQDAYGRMFLLNISSVVPEPGSIGYLALGGVTLLRRRRA